MKRGVSEVAVYETTTFLDGIRRALERAIDERHPLPEGDEATAERITEVLAVRTAIKKAMFAPGAGVVYSTLRADIQ